MSAGWDDARRRTVAAALDHAIPGDGVSPGAGEAGGAAYVEGLLGAFEVDPPRIWAGGPFSGRHGGEASFGEHLELGPWEAHAWRTRIAAWTATWDEGLVVLGDDFADLDDGARAARWGATAEDFRELVFTQACESLYGDPVYGGNRDRAAWLAVDFRGDSQPAGYTDAEVTNP